MMLRAAVAVNKFFSKPCGSFLMESRSWVATIMIQISCTSHSLHLFKKDFGKHLLQTGGKNRHLISVINDDLKSPTNFLQSTEILALTTEIKSYLKEEEIY